MLARINHFTVYAVITMDKDYGLDLETTSTTHMITTSQPHVYTSILPTTSLVSTVPVDTLTDPVINTIGQAPTLLPDPTTKNVGPTPETTLTSFTTALPYHITTTTASYTPVMTPEPVPEYPETTSAATSPPVNENREKPVWRVILIIIAACGIAVLLIASLFVLHRHRDL